MNTTPNENQNNQEVDLILIFRKVKEFFQSIRFGIFRFIQFCLKKIIYILILIVAGGVLGYLLDQNLPQKYKHETVVAVNFDSVEYLYNFINQKEIKDLRISKVTIAPILDVFPLISDNEDHLKALNFLSESGYDFTKYKKGSSSIFLYRYHLLTIYTQGKDEKKSVIKDFLDVINKNPYFVNRQKIEYANNQTKIEEYKKSIQNINSIFEKASQSNSNASVDITTYSQMDEMTKTKSLLLKQLNTLETQLAEQKVTLFPTVIHANIADTSLPNSIKLPVLFLLTFFIASWIVFWFKKTKQEYLVKTK